MQSLMQVTVKSAVLGDSALRMPIATVAKRTARGTLLVNTLYIRHAIMRNFVPTSCIIRDKSKCNKIY